MTKVSIIGAGMIPVSEYWGKGIRELAAEAGVLAMQDAAIDAVDAIYVGNAYGATYNNQTQLATLIADFMNLSGVEAYTCEAGDASGGVALRSGYLAIRSGVVKSALVLGVEKATDIVGNARTSARSISLDADYETPNGATLTTMAALLMRRYMHEYNLQLSDFEGFSVNAHRNGSLSSYAMFRNKLREGAFSKAPMLSDPVSLFDSAPDGDGAAAVVLVASDMAEDMVPQPVRILGSAVATDRLMIHERPEMLNLKAARKSASRALEQADVSIDDMSFIELHDAYTILSTLSIEALGITEIGSGWKLARNGGEAISLTGKMPLSTFGGLKSRGNPSGATGIYQTVESVFQLRNQANDNQISNAKHALIQNLGGLGSVSTTHILG
jgi:acetyl-CoA C-acetyltransferase